MSSNRHGQNDRYSSQYPPRSEASTTSTSGYLRPEDAYNMDSDVRFFGTSTSSHTSSRHGSDSHSPSHNDMTSTGYSQVAYTRTSDPYQQYQYVGTSQNASSTGSPYSSNRRLTPVEDYGPHSRHSPQSGTYKQTSLEFDQQNAHRSASTSPKDKGKQKQCDKQGSSRSKSGGSRHGSGDGGGERRQSATVDKLVHGVFIRY